MPTILLIQFAATWFMVGLIWLIQLVHYPLFAGVSEEGFVDYHQKHQMWITFIVGPVMIAELLTALVLAWYPPSGETALWMRIALGLLIVIWLATLLIQIPQHSRLESGYDAATIRALVNGNWIRTIAWTLRGLILVYVVKQVFDQGGS